MRTLLFFLLLPLSCLGQEEFFSGIGTRGIATTNAPPVSTNAPPVTNAPPIVNHAPALSTIGNKTVNEGSTLTFTATAIDDDFGQTLTYSLSSTEPGNASISSAGVFRFTPSNSQGPITYAVTVRVTDNGTPPLSDFETFQLTVKDTRKPKGHHP